MNLNYTFSNKAKRVTFMLMGIGVLALVYALVSGIDGQRIWANVLVDSFFFMAISLAITFFIAVQYAAESGWSTSVKRVFEAVSTYLPIGILCMLFILISGDLFHWHHLYEWMTPGINTKGSPEYDKIIAGKQGYFSPVFFWGRTLAYALIWWLFQKGFRKRSLEADLNGDLSIHFKNVKNAAIFLVLFGVTSSTAAWDWIMSIDTHWFSTLFGWYVFAGMWISALITVIMLVVYLKKKGYLEQVNESVIHDLGKWMFAISFLWSYLWFAQFMLIWYANIPEEVTYFTNRIDNYRWLFFGMFLINFVFPMVIMMSRDAKRNFGFLTTIATIIFIGHWLDVFVLIMPGTVKENWHINFLEIGMFLGFLGVFIFVVLTSLSKAPLMVKNHPYLDESIHHHI